MKSRHFASVLPLVSVLAHTAWIEQQVVASPPVTIEDLVTYTHIRNVSLSPDGRWVTYLTLEARHESNRYHAALVLQSTGPSSKAVALASTTATSDQVFNLSTGAIRNFGMQAAWAPDSGRLVYTRKVRSGVELLVKDVDTSRETKIGGFQGVESIEWNERQSIRFTEVLAGESAKDRGRATDLAMRVTDDVGFAAPPWFRPSAVTPATRARSYDVNSHTVVDAKAGIESPRSSNAAATYSERRWPSVAHETKYVLSPRTSPDKRFEAFAGIGIYHADDLGKAHRDSFVGIKTIGDGAAPRELLHAPGFIDGIAWSRDGKEVYGVQQNAEDTAIVAVSAEDGSARDLMRTPGELLWAGVSWARDSDSFVAARRTPFTPDELVRVDLATREIRVLSAPNAAFAGRAHPLARFMRVNNPLGGDIFGRLVLPNDYVKGQRYPLVFTTYRAGPGFLEGGVGEEFPILPYAAHGFVVFAMDTGISNLVSSTGDAEFTAMRLKRPLDAMETVRRQLADEGIVDPERCGITGLSYGSDISAYAVATSHTFKAASVSMMGLDPIAHLVNSVTRETALAASGMHAPDGTTLDEWRKRSAALNAATVTTPVLIQSSDAEAMFSVESFKALRRHNVPVDFYIYPGEGHLKFQPLNKLQVYRRNLDWMRFWLKGEEDADPTKADQYSRWRVMRDAFEERQKKAGR